MACPLISNWFRSGSAHKRLGYLILKSNIKLSLHIKVTIFPIPKLKFLFFLTARDYAYNPATIYIIYWQGEKVPITARKRPIHLLTSSTVGTAFRGSFRIL